MNNNEGYYAVTIYPENDEGVGAAAAFMASGVTAQA